MARGDRLTGHNRASIAAGGSGGRTSNFPFTRQTWPPIFAGSMLPILINVLLVLHVLVSLLIIFLVLMQRPKNEGLGAAFGGGMTENLFGAQTTNVLQTITRYLGGLFFALTLLLSYLYVQQTRDGGSSIQRRLSAPTTIPPAATPAPSLPSTLTPEQAPTAVSPPVNPQSPPLEKEATPEGTPSATPTPTTPTPTTTPPQSAPGVPPADQPVDKPADAAPAPGNTPDAPKPSAEGAAPANPAPSGSGAPNQPTPP